MSIDADMVRTLAAQREGTRLDFKQAQYDWKNGGNAELAKDLMAMANALGPRGGNAHILIGVQELSDHSGQVVGVAPSDHLDDASMHQKVQGLLNRVPDFSYVQVEVDGASVGVFEVRPGRRPVFPTVTAKGKLAPGVARYRDGSTTAEAWPDRIIEWFQEDHGDRLREAEVEALRIQTAVCPVVAAASVSGTSWEFLVTNGGMVPFTVATIQASLLPTAAVWRENGEEPPAELPRLDVKTAPPDSIPLHPNGNGMRGRADYHVDELTQRALGRTGGRSNMEWYDLEVRVEAAGPAGPREQRAFRFPHPGRRK